jgi:hypothetical protein
VNGQTRCKGCTPPVSKRTDERERGSERERDLRERERYGLQERGQERSREFTSLRVKERSGESKKALQEKCSSERDAKSNVTRERERERRMKEQEYIRGTPRAKDSMRRWWWQGKTQWIGSYQPLRQHEAHSPGNYRFSGSKSPYSRPGTPV